MMASRKPTQPPRVPARPDPISPRQEFVPVRPDFTASCQESHSPPAALRFTDSRLFTEFSAPLNLSNFSDPGPSAIAPMMAPNPTAPHTAIFLVEKSRRHAERQPALQEDLQGWDYEFSPRPDSKYECPICLLVLRDPMQTMCGHRFCSECIHKWLRTPPDVRCPVCNEIISDVAVFPDKFANREILGFPIKCPNYGIGCTMAFALKDLDEHLQCVCGYEEVQCPNRCRAALLRKDVQYHCDRECLNRMVLCAHCNQRVPITDEMAHCKVCPEINTNCEHCHQQYLRKDIEHHKTVDCTEAPATCSFYAVGCHPQLTRKSLEQHNETNMREHLDLLMQKLNLLMSNEPRDNSPRRHSSQIPNQDEIKFSKPFKQPYNNKRHAAPGSWEDLGNSVTCQHGISQLVDQSMGQSCAEGMGDAESLKPSFFDDLDEKRRHQDGQLVKHEQQLLALSAKVDSLDKKIREQVSVISQKDDTISALESRLCNGIFYWRIKEFSAQRQEAKTGLVTVLHSSGFYTSCHGYKLCIRANLNGVDGGNGSHISIFIHFMRGDFDDILDWPFTGRIVLTIMDQRDRKQHIVEILESKPNLAAFQRPHSNRNHKGFGYIEFAPIGLIENSSYVKNDTLIIKAEVAEL